MMLYAFVSGALALTSALGIVGALRIHRYPGYTRWRLIAMAGCQAFLGAMIVGAAVYMLSNMRAGVALVTFFAGINFVITSVIYFRVSRTRGKTILCGLCHGDVSLEETRIIPNRGRLCVSCFVAIRDIQPPQ